MPDPSPPFLPRGPLLALWALALLVLLAGLGGPVVQRTQEARVLATAREMSASHNPHDWLIPPLNGGVRMQKPPLAYWLAAAGFKAGGVTDFGGRLPFALAGWLLLAVVYRFGRDLYGPRFGFFSAAILLTSYMFFRLVRYAETDGLATLFVTASIYAFWRAARRDRGAPLPFHLGALFAALAFATKQGPAAFPFLFLIALAAAERNGALLKRFLCSGAPLTFLVVGGAWYAYALASPHAAVLRRELVVIASGANHGDWFWIYIPQLLFAAAPWTGLLVLGAVGAIRQARADPAARAIVIYTAVILVPLCLVGNKQPHYLVPLAPALAMLCAFALDWGLRGAPPDLKVARAVFWATVLVSAVAPVAVLVVARKARGSPAQTDLALVALLLATLVATVSTGKRHGLAGAFAVYAAGLALAFAVTFGRWLPSFEGENHRTIAAKLRASFGDGPYVFYGENLSLPLIWNLRTVAPQCETRAELLAVLAKDPETVVIAQTKNGQPPPPIPPLLDHVADLPEDHETMFGIYADAP